MNGIDKIITHINTEAEEESRAILEEASAKSEEIRASYEKAAREEYEKVMTKGTQDADTLVDRLGHVAALEAKKQALAVKQEMVSLAFEKAAEKLTELPEADYTAFLVRLAVSAARTGLELIVLSQSDKERYGNAVCQSANEALAAAGKAAKLTLSDQTRALRGGLILISGDIEVNCSIDTLMTQYKNELSSKVADVLFK